ncbi:LexA family protein [Gelidibacter gilvus]|uniref:LexA family protein n=1 Tax=Gelidibacter gilvus TaxID=59602 RepID=UPI001CB93C53|nr:winged helix-turn-helix domain-containing protein [Gelidibacter gilvus]
MIKTLTKRRKEVLKLIANNTTITYTEIAEALGINESPVDKHINALKTKGFYTSRRDTGLLANQY